MNKNSNKACNLIEDNHGSTLITVIVAIGFVTMLVAIILGTTLVNMRMKGVDKRNKDNFYYAEKALNDIYTEIGQQVQNQAAAAYETAFISVGRSITEDLGTKNEDGSDVGEETFDFETSEKAQEYYKKKFVAGMSTWLNAIVKDSSTKESSQLEGYISKASGKEYMVTVGSAVNEYYDDTNTKICGVRLQDVSVTCIDTAMSEQSVIATDIVVYIPELNFLETNAEVSDYSVIANSGMVANGNVTISGNVYVGTNSDNEATSGLHINAGETSLDSDRVISKGNIYVGSGKTETLSAKLTIGNDDHTTDLWVDSIKTVKGSTIPAYDASNINADGDYTIKLDANTYVLNDLELNCNNSKVVVSGNYYGYNDGGLATGETHSLDSTGTKHTDSSAVIVNGNGANLSMRDVSNFVLMGKAYIEPVIKNADGTSTKTGDEIATAEGVALKTNQQLYLVPTDFLECSNPTTNVDAFLKNSTGGYSISTIPDNWFGAKYLEVVDTKSEVAGKTDTTSKNVYAIDVVQVGSVYYAFFKFDETKTFYAVLNSEGEETGTIVAEADKSGNNYSAGFTARTGYIKEVMAGKESYDSNGKLDEAKPTAKQLRRRINLSISNTENEAFSLAQCIILDDDTTEHSYKDKNVYANNAVVSYIPSADSEDNKESGSGTSDGTATGGNTEAKFTIKAISNTAAKNRYSGYPQNLFYRFKWLCADLDGKDSTPLSATISKPEDSVKKPGSSDAFFEWKLDSDFPFVTVIGEDTGDNISNTGTNVSINNDVNTDTIDSSKYNSFVHLPGGSTLSNNVKGFVLCDGDLTVARGVKIKGTVIAKGTITFEGDNEVTADSLVLQKRIDAEEASVKAHDGCYRTDFLISYLIDENGCLKYQTEKTDESYAFLKSELGTFEYTDYVQFDNWQKGGR